MPSVVFLSEPSVKEVWSELLDVGPPADGDGDGDGKGDGDSDGDKGTNNKPSKRPRLSEDV